MKQKLQQQWRMAHLRAWNHIKEESVTKLLIQFNFIKARLFITQASQNSGPDRLGEYNALLNKLTTVFIDPQSWKEYDILQDEDDICNLANRLEIHKLDAVDGFRKYFDNKRV